MHSVLSKFNHFLKQHHKSFLPWRWTIIILFFIISGFMIYGMMTRFTMDMSLESWFQENDPVKLSLDKFRKQFGSDDGIYIVYEAKDGDVFSEQSLNTLRALHTELDNARIGLNTDGQQGLSAESMLPRVERIDSLYNARYQIAQGDTLISNKLIAASYPTSDEVREQRRNIALSQESFELSYYSKQFKYGGIRLKTDFGVVPVQNEITGAAKGKGADLLSDEEFEN